MAVADNDPDGQPPGELRLSWWCGDTRLPEAGGVLDQDYVTMHRMTAFRNIFEVVRRTRGLHGKDIHKLSDGERLILRSLIDEGML